MHFDLRAPGAVEAEVARLEALGASVVWHHPSHTVMQDPEGNELHRTRACARARLAPAPAAPPSVPHARVDDRVQDIHDQIGDNNEERRQHDHTKDLREIVVLDREDREQAQAVE
jgi:Glyoxalase-like domain